MAQANVTIGALLDFVPLRVCFRFDLCGEGDPLICKLILGCADLCLARIELGNALR